jgi:hypothetical protein
MYVVLLINTTKEYGNMLTYELNSIIESFKFHFKENICWFEELCCISHQKVKKLIKGAMFECLH